MKTAQVTGRTEESWDASWQGRVGSASRAALQVIPPSSQPRWGVCCQKASGCALRGSLAFSFLFSNRSGYSTKAKHKGCY